MYMVIREYEKALGGNPKAMASLVAKDAQKRLWDGYKVVLDFSGTVDIPDEFFYNLAEQLMHKNLDKFLYRLDVRTTGSEKERLRRIYNEVKRSLCSVNKC